MATYEVTPAQRIGHAEAGSMPFGRRISSLAGKAMYSKSLGQWHSGGAREVYWYADAGMFHFYACQPPAAVDNGFLLRACMPDIVHKCHYARRFQPYRQSRIRDGFSLNSPMRQLDQFPRGPLSVVFLVEQVLGHRHLCRKYLHDRHHCNQLG